MSEQLQTHDREFNLVSPVILLIITLGVLGITGLILLTLDHADTSQDLESSQQHQDVLIKEVETTTTRVLKLCRKDGHVARVLLKEGVCSDSAQLKDLAKSSSGSGGGP